MDITFKNKKLQKIFNSEKLLNKEKRRRINQKKDCMGNQFPDKETC